VSDTEEPAITVGICTLNRLESLPAAIESVLLLHRKPEQLVVVCGPSTDGTREYLEGRSDDFEIVCIDDANLSRARNEVIRQARGRFVAFIDDDAVADPYWLSSLIPIFDDPLVAAVGGPVLQGDGVSVQSGASAVNGYGDVIISERPLRWIGRAGGWWTSYPTGTNAVFRRTALLDVHGFDEFITYFHDETELCRRLVDAGWRVELSERGFVHHNMLQGVARPQQGGFDHPLLMRSEAYVALRHGDRYRGHSGTEEAIAQMALRRKAAARAERPDGPDSDASIDAALAAARIAASGPPQCPLRPDRRDDNAAARPLRPLPPEPHGARHIVLICRPYETAPHTGIAQSYRQIASCLHRLGHVVRVLSATNDGAPIVRAGAVPVVHAIPIAGDASHDAWQSAARQALDEVEKRWPVDLVIAPNWNSEGLAIVRAGGRRVASTIHTPISVIAEVDRRLDPLSDLVSRLQADEVEQLAGSEVVLASTETIIAEIERRCALQLSPRAHIVGRGFDDTVHRRAEAPSGDVVFVGRADARKGIQVLLDAWPIVSTVRPDAILTLCGDLDAADDDLAQRIRSVGAHATGVIPEADLHRRLAAAAAVVVPSLYESFGLVAAEALRAGVPVVASNVGGLPDVIGPNGLCGLLVPAGDPAALAAAIETVLSDAVRNAAMGLAGRQRFEQHFSADALDTAMRIALEVLFPGARP
jgi:glycogen synthase